MLMRPGSLLKDRVTIVAFTLYLVIDYCWILGGALQVVDGGDTDLQERKASKDRPLLPHLSENRTDPCGIVLGPAPATSHHLTGAKDTSVEPGSSPHLYSGKTLAEVAVCGQAYRPGVCR